MYKLLSSGDTLIMKVAIDRWTITNVSAIGPKLDADVTDWVKSWNLTGTYNNNDYSGVRATLG